MNFHRFPTQLGLFNSAVILITTLLLSPALLAATDCTYPSPQSDIPQAECQALLDLYTNTAGATWTDSPANNWNVTNTPCSWTGVTCSGGVVTQLIRSSQNLSGSPNPYLNGLTNLTSLDLSHNSLNGNLPITWPSTNLTYIALNNNQFGGSIPTLPAGLTYLNLSYNTSVSGSIPILPASLTYLDLRNDQSLSGGIPSLPTGLTYLDLSYNNLSGTIPSLPASLTYLDLSYNYTLSGSIPSLPAGLTNLDLSSNILSGSIPSLPASLTTFKLMYNGLTGSIPTLPASLTLLYLVGDQLTGSIPTLPASLTQLSLSYNSLTGTIPSLPASLTQLYLFNNSLSGTIPPLPVGLIGLNLSYNALTGTLPSFASLASLTTLDLGYNALTSAASGEDALVLSKQATWKDTQTVGPTGLTATALSTSSVQLTWTPITYTIDGGYYQVKYATTPGGPYTNASSPTVDKTVSSYTVTGLTPGTPYYFVVETYTPAHSGQPNNLTSILLAGQETAITTPPVPVTPPPAPVTPPPPVTVTPPTPTCQLNVTITTANDTGPGSLRDALIQICPKGQINFATTLTSPI
jgi:Leucine-rich repeat (LRR) protein